MSYFELTSADKDDDWKNTWGIEYIIRRFQECGGKERWRSEDSPHKNLKSTEEVKLLRDKSLRMNLLARDSVKPIYSHGRERQQNLLERSGTVDATQVNWRWIRWTWLEWYFAAKLAYLHGSAASNVELKLGTHTKMYEGENKTRKPLLQGNTVGHFIPRESRTEDTLRGKVRVEARSKDTVENKETKRTLSLISFGLGYYRLRSVQKCQTTFDAWQKLQQSFPKMKMIRKWRCWLAWQTIGLGKVKTWAIMRLIRNLSSLDQLWLVLLKEIKKIAIFISSPIVCKKYAPITLMLNTVQAQLETWGHVTTIFIDY